MTNSEKKPVRLTRYRKTLHSETAAINYADVPIKVAPVESVDGRTIVGYYPKTGGGFHIVYKSSDECYIEKENQ